MLSIPSLCFLSITNSAHRKINQGSYCNQKRSRNLIEKLSSPVRKGTANCSVFVRIGFEYMELFPGFIKGIGTDNHRVLLLSAKDFHETSLPVEYFP